MSIVMRVFEVKFTFYLDQRSFIKDQISGERYHEHWSPGFAYNQTLKAHKFNPKTLMDIWENNKNHK